jgi:cell division protein FtsQ
LLCAVGLVAAGGAVFWYTGAFGVARVTVDGTGITTPDMVRAAAGVSLGTPLARLDTAEIARRVGRLPPIRQATVDRVWPRTVTIRVVERTPVAVIPVENPVGFLTLDETGVAYQRLPVAPAGLPTVRLASPSPSDVTTRGALSVLRSLPQPLLASLAALWAEGPARIRLELVDHRTVVWGDATENEIKGRVALELLSRPDLTGQGKSVYDVSAPYVPTIR